MSAPVIVKPGEIQAELSRIWDSLEVKNKMRASLFNIIFYTENHYREEYLRKVAEKVVEKFPSRIIFISVDQEGDPNLLNAAVSILPASETASDIACDLIQLNVSKSQQDRIPFLILPHFIPDLPIYLVWGDNPSKDNPLADQLERLTNRTIFDSETADNLADFAKSLLEHHERSSCDIADLNWARLEGWRMMLCSIFHHCDRLEDLKNTKVIHIEYNACETRFFCHNKIQAIYLQGWLASRLGWKLEKIETGEKLQFHYENTSITLSPRQHTNLAPGTIVSLDMLTNDEKHYLLKRKEECPNHVSIQISTKEECEIPTQFIFPKTEASGQSLVKEITNKGTSEHFLDLLNFITNFYGMLND